MFEKCSKNLLKIQLKFASYISALTLFIFFVIEKIKNNYIVTTSINYMNPVEGGTPVDVIPKTAVVNDNISCTDFGDLVTEYWGYLALVVPMILIVLTVVEYLKVVMASDEEAFKKANTNTIKRILAGIVLLFTPLILKVIFGLFGISFCL